MQNAAIKKQTMAEKQAKEEKEQQYKVRSPKSFFYNSLLTWDSAQNRCQFFRYTHLIHIQVTVGYLISCLIKSIVYQMTTFQDFTFSVLVA